MSASQPHMLLHFKVLHHKTEIDDLLKKHIQETGKLMEQQSNE